jgi:dinuclear metal center YbgI/SA1388 family protein
VTEDDAAGRKVIKLIKNDISAICMHTNLDAAESGVNDALARAIGLHDTALLSVEGTGENGKPYGIGLFGRLTAPVSLNEFLAHVKKALQAKGLRYYDAGRGVCQVAVVGGSGGDELEQAVRTGCDTFLTADIKYHQFLQAKDLGINLIDGGHFCTENVIVPVLTEKLRSRFPGTDVMISTIHGQTDEYF